MNLTDSTTVSVQNPGKVIEPFWPEHRERLILIFENYGDIDIVHGLNPGNSMVVFWAVLHRGQQDEFVEAVKEGAVPQPMPPSPSGSPADSDTDITSLIPGAANIICYTIVVGGQGSGEGAGPRRNLISADPDPTRRLDLPRRSAQGGGTGDTSTTAPAGSAGNPPLVRVAGPQR